jgi:hypothetical protein
MILIGITLLGYFVPTVIAAFRGHRNTIAITILNLLTGWTLIGWVIALIWSVLAAQETSAAAAPQIVTPDPTVWDRTAIYGSPVREEKPLASKLSGSIFKD